MWARVTARTAQCDANANATPASMASAQQSYSSRAAAARYPHGIRAVSAPYPRRIRVVSGSEPELSQTKLVDRSSTESGRWHSPVDRIRSGCCAAAARLQSSYGLAMFRLLRGYSPATVWLCSGCCAATVRLRSGSLSASFGVQCIMPIICVTATNANGQIVLSRMSLSLVSRQLSQRLGCSAPIVRCRRI